MRAMIKRNSEECEIHEEVTTGDVAFVLAEDGPFEKNHIINSLDKVHKAPDDWVASGKKKGDSEPDFEVFDKPGN